MVRTGLARLRIVLVALVALFGMAGTARAANCYVPTGQGSTGPSDWATYCWIDFTSYNSTTASSAAGQNFSLVLQDGTTLSFNLKASGARLTAVAAPSWNGAAIGNTAMTGIGGLPVLYQTGGGTTTVTISSITLTPPANGSGVTNYMMVMADGESTNTSETLSFATNGAAWLQLDQAGPISGSSYPTLSGTGTTTVTETGTTTNAVGAYIFGSTRPSQVSATLVGSGLQGMMLAVRFASIRLTMQIADARANASDQFTYAVNATSNGATFVSGTSSGTGLGPFATAGLSTAAAVPMTLAETIAGGSAGTLADYQTSLTCTNATSGSSTVLPNGVLTTSYALPALAYNDALQCTFTATPYPHLLLQKALGSGGRQYNTDQFALTIAQGTTTLATTTTSGTGSTLTNAATANTRVTAGTAYTMTEGAAGTSQGTQYTAAIACTNAYAGSSTTLPTSATAITTATSYGGRITPAMGDVVTCTITNTKVAANANLTIAKTSSLLSDPVNGSINPKSIPGAIVTYTLTVANTGPSTVTANSVFIVDALPGQISVGTASNPTFIQGSPSSGLTFTRSTDIAYSNATTAPTSFAACTYTPVASYDPSVHFVCLNPKGTFAGSTGTPPSFQLSIQAQIN